MTYTKSYTTATPSLRDIEELVDEYDDDDEATENLGKLADWLREAIAAFQAGGTPPANVPDSALSRLYKMLFLASIGNLEDDLPGYFDQLEDMDRELDLARRALLKQPPEPDKAKNWLHLRRANQAHVYKVCARTGSRCRDSARAR